MDRIEVDPPVRQRRQLLLGALALAAGGAGTGCATTAIKGDLRTEWRAMPIPDADVMPKLDPDAVNRRTRVVVFQPQDSQANRGAGLAAVAAGALQGVLGKGGVELIDRSMAGKLNDELRLAEMRGTAAAAYGGPDVADFAITVAMGTAGGGSKYNEGFSFKDKKGQTITIPPSWTHNATSTMTVRVYELPSLRLVQSIPVDASTSNTGQSGQASQAQVAVLMRTATENGINSKRNDILNEFSPKGYVVERRGKEKEKASIFRVMLGKQTGSKTGDPVVIYSLQRDENPLTKKVSMTEVRVAGGRLSDVVGNDESWVLVDDEKEARRVRRGDIVRVKLGSGGLGEIVKDLPGVLTNLLR